MPTRRVRPPPISPHPAVQYFNMSNCGDENTRLSCRPLVCRSPQDKHRTLAAPAVPQHPLLRQQARLLTRKETAPLPIMAPGLKTRRRSRGRLSATRGAAVLRALLLVKQHPKNSRRNWLAKNESCSGRVVLVTRNKK